MRCEELPHKPDLLIKYRHMRHDVGAFERRSTRADHQHRDFDAEPLAAHEAHLGLRLPCFTFSPASPALRARDAPSHARPLRSDMQLPLLLPPGPTRGRVRVTPQRYPSRQLAGPENRARPVQHFGIPQAPTHRLQCIPPRRGCQSRCVPASRSRHRPEASPLNSSTLVTRVAPLGSEMGLTKPSDGLSELRTLLPAAAQIAPCHPLRVDIHPRRRPAPVKALVCARRSPTSASGGRAAAQRLNVLPMGNRAQKCTASPPAPRCTMMAREQVPSVAGRRTCRGRTQ